MGDKERSDKKRKVVFVTVVTTCVDALVRAVVSEHVKKELFAKDYTHLLIQMGRGSYVPTESEGVGSLVLDYFTFSSSIADHLRSASLVASHTGDLDCRESESVFFSKLRLIMRLIRDVMKYGLAIPPWCYFSFNPQQKQM